MFKKILTGALAAVLIVAASASAYTALASPEETVPTRAVTSPDSIESQPLLVVDQAASSEIITPETPAAGLQANQGQGRGGTGIQASPVEITTVSGVINSYEYRTITVAASAGESIVVQLGSSYYAESIGFFPQVGEQAAITGFYDTQGMFSAITITLDASGQTYAFRDDTGRPLWSGGGGGNGNNRSGNGRRGGNR
ncbi:MAG: hypothetical protein JXA13_10855 [Anaerolineales bacterium]|nr:hypothetical protein [Anaerolineales bacterium]